jgi:hypothetical protein
MFICSFGNIRVTVWRCVQISGGIKAYTEPKPSVVMVTSAAVERNAYIGDDPEKRKKDIPIVQLNPGGTLNHKYAGEMAIRAAGLPYTVIRATGGPAPLVI